MNAGDSFFAIKNFARGKISKYQLMDADPFIDYVYEDYRNPAQSKVTLKFLDEQKFLKLLGLNDDDIWAAIRLGSRYDPYEYYDSYQTKDDFYEGYGPWNYLNDSNQELVNKISKLLGIGEIDFSISEDISKVAHVLEKLYPQEVNNLCSDFTHEKNVELNSTADDFISKELSNFVESYGFELIPYEGVKTTVANLLSLYLQYNVPHVSLQQLLTEVFKTGEDSIGGWSDNIWEWSDDKNFDSETFNRDAERIFEKILNDLESDGDVNPFLSMVERISKNFKTDTWYDLPKDKRLMIKVDGFDRDSKKINVRLKGKTKEIDYDKKFSISEEGFYKLLYNLELFDFVNK